MLISSIVLNIVANFSLSESADAANHHEVFLIVTVPDHHLVPLYVVGHDEIRISYCQFMPHRLLELEWLEDPEVLCARLILSEVCSSVDASINKEVSVVGRARMQRSTCWRLMLELHFYPWFEPVGLQFQFLEPLTLLFARSRASTCSLEVHQADRLSQCLHLRRPPTTRAPIAVEEKEYEGSKTGQTLEP